MLKFDDNLKDDPNLDLEDNNSRLLSPSVDFTNQKCPDILSSQKDTETYNVFTVAENTPLLSHPANQNKPATSVDLKEVVFTTDCVGESGITNLILKQQQLIEYSSSDNIHSLFLKRKHPQLRYNNNNSNSEFRESLLNNRLEEDMKEDLSPEKPLDGAPLIYPSLLGHRHSFPFFDMQQQGVPLIPSIATTNNTNNKSNVIKETLNNDKDKPVILNNNLQQQLLILPIIREPSLDQTGTVEIDPLSDNLTKCEFPLMAHDTTAAPNDDDSGHGSLLRLYLSATTPTPIGAQDSTSLPRGCAPPLPSVSAVFTGLPTTACNNNSNNNHPNSVGLGIGARSFLASSATRLFGGSGLLVPPSPGSSVHFYIGTNPHGSMASVMTNTIGGGANLLVPYAAPFYFQPVLLKDKYPHYYRQHFQQIAKGITDDPSYLANSSSFVISESGALVLCRICQTPGTEDSLISPCKCTGSVRYVHKNCLTKWLEINPNRNRKSQTCELCQYTYHRAKKFKFQDWKWPQCSRRDKLFHLLFIVSMLVMIGCASAFIVCFKRDKGIRKHEDLELNETEIITLSCGVLFFLSFFLGMYAEIKAYNPIYKVCAQTLSMNQSWIIEEYYSNEEDDEDSESQGDDESDNNHRDAEGNNNASNGSANQTIQQEQHLQATTKTRNTNISPFKSSKLFLTSLFKSSGHKQLLSHEERTNHRRINESQESRQQEPQIKNKRRRRKKRKLRTIKSLFENNLEGVGCSPNENDSIEYTYNSASKRGSINLKNFNEETSSLQDIPSSLLIIPSINNNTSITANNRINILPTIKEVITIPSSAPQSLSISSPPPPPPSSRTNKPPLPPYRFTPNLPCQSLQNPISQEFVRTLTTPVVISGGGGNSRERTISEDQTMFYSDPALKSFDPSKRHFSLPINNVLLPIS